MMETKQICPSCRKTLPPYVPLGLCPECLMKAGFNTGTDPASADKSRFVPPSVAELAPHFPQLEILELIGQGGMGAVYKARQIQLDRFVALKILPPGAVNDAGYAERFNREARALARLNHPHIVAVHDFGQANGQPYLVMEFVDGANLRQVEQAGRLAPEQALETIPQICEALQFAHNEGVVHRDIKPENILLDKKGRVKITDFGIAKIGGVPSGRASLTGVKDVLGTPHYMAPEQVEHPQTVDHRADIYSLGVVFYEMLTGELPLGKFQSPSKKVQMDVRLDEVVLHALAKEPERRYQQVSEVKTDVETIAATPGQSSSRREEASSAGEHGRLPLAATRYNPWELAITVGGTTLLLALLFFATATLHTPVKLLFMAVCIIGLVLCALRFAGLWPFPSPLFPKPNFSSRNLPGGKARLPTPTSADQSKVEAVRRQVNGPAIGLMVLSGLALFVLAGALVIWTCGAVLSVGGKARLPWIAVIPILLLMTGCNLVGLIGAWRMRQLRSHSLAVAGSILFALSPWFGLTAGINCGVPHPVWSCLPGILLGLLCGIWSLVVLSHREVREAFGKSHPLRLPPTESPRPAHGNGAWKVATVIVAAVMMVLAIPVGALLLAIAIPNFNKARQRALAARTNATLEVRSELSSGGTTDGSNAAALTQEGWQLWQGGRPADAVPKFESAVKLDPKNTAAWNGLGWASFNSGKSPEAGQAFQKVIEVEPDHPAALNGLGQVYLAQKKYAEAESYLLKASAKAPAAWFGLARLYLLQGKFEQAEKWAQNVVDSGQADETVRLMLQAARDRKLPEGLRMMIEPQ